MGEENNNKSNAKYFIIAGGTYIYLIGIAVISITILGILVIVGVIPFLGVQDPTTK